MASAGGAISMNFVVKMPQILSRGLFGNVERLSVYNMCQCRERSSATREQHRQVDESQGEEEEFRVLDIPGFNSIKPIGIYQMFNPREKRKARAKDPVQPPRYKSMKPDQDWTAVWPSASTFKYSAVPLPIRQGMIFRDENEGIPPAKYANAELMKIPNFFHLTPKHIKMHCASLKKFCTKWPEGLETDEACDAHFPLTVTTSDYVFDGSSIREPEARRVTLKIKLSDLNLDYHARDKLIRLVTDRYDKETDVLTIVADRCPTRVQNNDYAMYLLTALNFESKKTEPWESEKTVADMERYVWEIMPSKQSLFSTLGKMKEVAASHPDVKCPAIVEKIPIDAIEEKMEEFEELVRYKKVVTDLHNEGETLERLENYKDSVKKLLIG